MNLYGNPGDPVRSDRLGYTNVYTGSLVGNICNGPCSAYYNTLLYWRMTISTSAGYGHTWATGPFTITTP